MLDHLLSFDRDVTLFINGSDNIFWDQVIFVATSTWTWVPMGLVMLWILWKNLSPRQFAFAVGCLALAVLISDQLSSAVFKPYFQRWRPSQDPALLFLVDLVHDYRGGRFGFFSAHASNTFSVATFLACLIRNRKLNILIFSWSVVNCYTRLYLGVHYMGDILVGTCFGLLIGATLAYYYRRHILQGSVKPLVDGAYIPLFSCAIVLSYCLAFIYAEIYFLM